MKTTRFFAILFLFIAPVVSAQVTLKFNPEEGVNYIYKMNSKQNINTKIPNPNDMSATVDMAMTWDMVITWDMVVLKKTKTESEIQFTYSDILFLIESPVMKIEYSPTMDAENLNEQEKKMKESFDLMIGKPVIVTIATNGKVTSIKGTENIINSAEMANAGIPFDENSIKNMLEQAINVYPDKPVNIGESWNIPLNINISGMLISTDSTYTLKSEEDGIANIDVTSVIDTKWATAILRDFTLRGYIIDRKRMENGAFLDDDYFERLSYRNGIRISWAYRQRLFGLCRRICKTTSSPLHV